MIICVLDENNIVINILEAPYCYEENHRVCNSWDFLGELYSDVEPLGYAKTRYIAAEGKEFARRRDAIRWVDGYGYDCNSEDITNFMAAFTPLLVAGTGSVYYKVWLTETTKGVIERTYEQMLAVYNSVRTNQLEAYSWYEGIKTQLNSDTVKTIADLETIFPLNG